jgi:hypothetical protein
VIGYPEVVAAGPLCLGLERLGLGITGLVR